MTEASRAIGKFIEVNQAGQIISVWSTSEEAAAGVIDAGKLPIGHYLVAMDGDPDTQYYQAGRVIDRPLNTARISGNKVVDIPLQSFVFFRGDRYLCNDGFVEFDIDQEDGEQDRVLIKSFPHQDIELFI